MIVTLQSIAAFLLVLGPLIFIHEMGHFLVAKRFGIGVPVFSLGIGPRLFGFRRGETDYRLSLFPLGGYVRLEGDEADENRHGGPGEFLSRPKWQRFFVFVAGATFNILLAFVAMWFLYAVWGSEEMSSPDPYPTVRVVAEDSPASRGGLAVGDVLVELGGRDLVGVDGFREAYMLEVQLSPEATKTLVVERAGETVELELTIGSDPTYGHGTQPGWSLSWGGDETPVIVDVYDGGRAVEAGLEAGDRVVAANGRRPISDQELRLLLESSPERPVDLSVDRDGSVLDVTVVPADEDGKGRIGVSIGLPTVHRDYGLFEAAGASFRENLSNSVLLFRVLQRMITRDVPLKSVSGPIGIAQVARRALIASPRHFIWLLGFFSLQLGILNLLPIPVLDGGHILILAIEGAARRDLSERLKERVMQVGFVFLLAFMSVVIYLDILKL